MQVEIVAIGRMKSGPERDLCDRYLERAGRVGRSLGFQGFTEREFAEDRAQDAKERRTNEAALLAAAAEGADVRICLDEGGEPLDSAAFAARLRRLADDGRRRAAFLIGGPDGLHGSLRKDATSVLAFGRWTWPHQIVRILLAEQLYRAMTILGGHPYHRS